MTRHRHYPLVLACCDEVLDLIGKGYQAVQVDIDPTAYDHGHLPGALSWNWESQLRNPESHEILTKEEVEHLLGCSGITPETPLLLYGDNNNWFACWAFWMLKLYGHKQVFLVDGGLNRWLKSGLPLEIGKPEIKVA